MNISDINWPVILIAFSGALILLLRDWRITVSALLVNYVGVALFLAQQQFLQPDLHIGSVAASTTVLVKLISGIAATAILAITALTFSREYNQENLDEFSLAELRRAGRAARRQRAAEPLRLADYVVPFWTLALAVLASVALPRIYPIGKSTTIDFVWYWLGLIGLFTMVVAGDLLKVGLGLLLCAGSVDVLYIAISRGADNAVQIFPLALLGLVSITLALAVAYLSGLLYGRLKTLELNELYKR
jgi:hypothetical protein